MTARGEIQLFRETLDNARDQFLRALPPQIPVDRFLRTVMTAVQMQPSLLGGDRRSLIASCMKAAQDGLLTDGREAALCLFGDTVQYMPMVRGILKKMHQSGEIRDIAVHVVYEEDEFSYELGDSERIVHKPAEGARKVPTHVYAIVHTVNGGTYRAVMTAAEVEAVRARSRSSRRGPWDTDWAEMAKKTIIRRIAKLLPSCVDVEAVMNHEAEAQLALADAVAKYQDAPQAEARPRLARLHASLSRATQATDGPAEEVTDAAAVPDAV